MWVERFWCQHIYDHSEHVCRSLAAGPTEDQVTVTVTSFRAQTNPLAGFAVRTISFQTADIANSTADVNTSYVQQVSGHYLGGFALVP